MKNAIFEKEKELKKKKENNQIKYSKPKQINLISYSRNISYQNQILRPTTFKEQFLNNKNKLTNTNSLNLSYNQKKNINNNKKLSCSMKDIRKSMLYSNRLNKKTNSMNKTMNENLNNQFEIYLKNKYGKYNTLEQTYKIANEYSKMEFYDKDFLQRMDNYSSKKRLQEAKIKELLNKQKPTLPEEKLIKTFNRLINDSNRRNEEKKNKLSSDDILMNEINQNLKKNKSHKSIRKKNNWDDIYNERFKSKLNLYNQKIKKQRENSLKEQKLKEENELKEMKKYNKKIFMSPEKLNEITKRLYYKPISNKLITNLQMLKKKNRELDNLSNATNSSRLINSPKNYNNNNKENNNNNNNNNNNKINIYKNNVPLSRVERIIDDFFTDK